jgi:RimJ/RimL family protein N-acetyltransferase
MLLTDRLILRPYTLDDYEPYFAMKSDPMLGDVISREDAWQRVLRFAGHWALLGYGNFSIIEKEKGQYVGETGLWRACRQIADDFDGCPETGWSIAASAQGHGFAFEAASAAHLWYQTTKKSERSVCMIDPGNVRSIKLAKRLGYNMFRSDIYKGNPVDLFERFPA